jgi:hypothetical protein
LVVFTHRGTQPIEQVLGFLVVLFDGDGFTKRADKPNVVHSNPTGRNPAHYQYLMGEVVSEKTVDMAWGKSSRASGI